MDLCLHDAECRWIARLGQHTTAQVRACGDGNVSTKGLFAWLKITVKFCNSLCFMRRARRSEPHCCGWGESAPERAGFPLSDGASRHVRDEWRDPSRGLSSPGLDSGFDLPFMGSGGDGGDDGGGAAERSEGEVREGITSHYEGGGGDVRPERRKGAGQA